MILVDTSVWVDHLRNADAAMVDALNRGRVLAHPFVIGEIALGSLGRRTIILDALNNLPSAISADDTEVLILIEQHRLFALGIGYVDAHLLASALLTGVPLWTRDKRLREVATRLGIGTGIAG